MKTLVRRSQHTRWNGVPKRKYLTAESADEAAARMRYVTEQMFDSYVCGECDQWHVGHSRQTPVSAQVDLVSELGERVMAHMKAENMGSGPRRLTVVKKRVYSAWKVAVRQMVA